MLEEKIKESFANMIVLKDPKRSEFFSNLSLPSYMRDWLVMKFSDKQGQIDYDSVLDYIKKFIPNREGFQVMKYNMMCGETVKFLARIRMYVNLKRNLVEFELPDFGGVRGGASGIVSDDVLEEYAESLLSETENWGIVELTIGSNLEDSYHNSHKFLSSILSKYKTDDSAVNKTKIYSNEIYMTGFKPFCPYRVDLAYYKKARSHFNIHEWIDVVISAIDFNPDGFKDSNTGEIREDLKLVFLRRLLPFIENRINLIELAPKGTGKSYVFEKISKRGWLISGGTVSRASLIYDNAKKTAGLLSRFDFVGFDEVQSITFKDPGQIQQALKHYMEFGELKGNDALTVSSAGVIVMGNLDQDKWDVNNNMVEKISTVFSESALMDRFHGFIPGWLIPRINESMKANGWAINTEYFAEAMHLLREDLSYSTIVDACLDVPPKADSRDYTAIKRLCTALVKLLYPNAISKKDIPKEEFIHYCLNPAKEMRSVIKKQLCIIDPEFNVPGKRDIPDIQYKDD